MAARKKAPLVGERRYAEFAAELDRLTAERDEARARAAALAEMLQVINASPGDLEPVFDGLLDRALRLCRAPFGSLHRYDGAAMHLAAFRGDILDAAALEWFETWVPEPNSAVGAILKGAPSLHIKDVRDTEAYRSGMPSRVKMIDVTGARSTMWVALRRDNRLLGIIVIYRREVQPFADTEIALVRSFADQAVIAIENARLITETRAALEQQTATSEVLQVINSSPGDLAPVFEAILDKAHALCSAERGTLFLYDGGRMKAAVAHGYPSDVVEHLRAGVDLAPHHAPLFAGNRVHIADLRQDGNPTGRIVSGRGGVRTNLLVPLFRNGSLLGMISCNRTEVRPFSEKEIVLIENFAAQAVIAMENARLITETREALDQQTATAEVLGVINSSPGDLAPVFGAMLEKAMRLCEARTGHLLRYSDGVFSRLASLGIPDDFDKLLPLNQPLPHVITKASVPYRTLVTRSPINIADLCDDASYLAGAPAETSAVNDGGVRSVLFVPLLKDGEVIGNFVMHRLEVRSFSDKHIALLENFAAQAVIAMENARLLGELRRRTDDLQESLKYQTATSDVLKVMSGSAFDIQPVLDSVAATALRLCRADHAGIYRNEGGVYRWAAGFLQSPEYERIERATDIHTGAGTLVGRTALEGRPVQIIDALTDPLYETKEELRISGAHTLLGVPLMREGLPIGVIGLGRNRVEAFAEKEIELVGTFADQAVIAMENARLITETREALEQQTATAEVLGVINSSPGDLTPVFDAVLEKALRLSGASNGALVTFDGQFFQAVASRGNAAGFDKIVRHPYRPEPVHEPLLLGERYVHIPDVTTAFPGWAGAMIGGFCTILLVSLRKDGALLGFLAANRREVRPFGDKEIALVESFAAQAVIAMENARLLGELRERTDDLSEALEYQTATSDALEVVSHSTFDLQAVLDTLAETMARLCRAEMAFILRRDGEVYRAAAAVGWSPAYRTFLEQHPIAPDRGTVTGRVVLESRAVHVADITADPEYVLTEATTLGNAHTQLGVPLLREGIPIGVIILSRQRVEPFTERQIKLVTTFADQAVIAIENARLITETREARDDAEKALGDLKAAQASLMQAEKLASLGQLTAGIAHEIKNPLNFVNNFASLSVELLDELKDTTAPAVAALAEDKRAEVDETMVMLTGNLEKIAEHGKRADNIVKSMLEHSRGVSGERREVDLNGVIEEALNLAYHGARAQDQSFNITLERAYAETLKPLELAPQEITRVFLNLFGNGFYAANKRARENGDGSFRPILTVATREDGDAVEIRVRDNGTGIPPEIRDRLFQPFFTTKPTGEGTGLGLSISYDIVTQQHGGTITVESEPGAFTEFTVRLPRT